MSWTLQNKWSPIAPFHHRMKFEIEYMDESYIKIITQAHRQLSNPAIDTDERTLLLSKIISTCLEAQGPTQELYESMSSDPETAMSLKNRRMTLDKELEAPVHTKNKDTEIMAPPKSLPKKTKPKGKENVVENAKAKRPSEENVNKTKKTYNDSELSKKHEMKSPNEVIKEKLVNKEKSVVVNLNKEGTKTNVSKVDKLNTNNVNKDSTNTGEANPKSKEENTKTKEANTTTKEANTKNKEANTKTKEANAKTKEANAKSKEANIKTKVSNTKTKEASTKTKELMDIDAMKSTEQNVITKSAKNKTTPETNTSNNTSIKGTAITKINKADSGKKLSQNEPNTDNIEKANKEINHEKQPMKSNNKNKEKVENMNLKDKPINSNSAKTVKKLNTENKDNAKTKPSKIHAIPNSDKIEKNQVKTVFPNNKQVNNVQHEHIKNKPQTKDVEKAKTVSSKTKVPNKLMTYNDKENKETTKKIKEKTNNEVEKVVEKNKNVANLKRKSNLAELHDKGDDNNEQNVASAKKPKLSKPEIAKNVTNNKSDKPEATVSNSKKAQDIIKPQNKMINKFTVNNLKNKTGSIKTLKTGNIQRVFNASNMSRQSSEKASKIPQKKSLNSESKLKKNPLRISPSK
ncbi:unnamed protein product [Diatraea saccharalis]|uniref:Uncharacterized protein n=1 Tax=Diatraea saccharalis TaxID=40085 RepID=A0A9P0C559_9NEOP|nr:unnamed protein product [Diatraea saccharalis]